VNIPSVDKISELYKKGVSRRNFLVGAGAAGAASVLAGCGDNSPAMTTTTTPTTTYTDADVLNFALNLEYLEASFYLYAATGSGLPSASTTGVGTAGTVTGGAQVTGLTTAQQNILNEIAFDELAHVNFLRSALGSAAVAMPNINIGTAFNTLASAASIASTFNPYASFANFLLGAFIFEDVGVTAYSGAAPLLTSATNLNYAAGIQAVEAYHAAYVRTTITALNQSLGSTAFPILGYANSVSALRSTLGGGNETNLTALPATIATSGNYTASSVVAATSANAIAYARSTDQVLHIVYGAAGGAGLSSGVFYPNGMNGLFTKTAS
jgi:hypothetical protein